MSTNSVLVADLTEVRVREPHRIAEWWQRRRRRRWWVLTGVCSWWPPIIPPEGAGRARFHRHGQPQQPARTAGHRRLAARRRRGARHARHPRRPPAARGARRQGRHRVDEPRGLQGATLRAGRPVHRLPRPRHRRERARRRQDAHSHLPRRRRHVGPPSRPARTRSPSWRRRTSWRWSSPSCRCTQGTGCRTCSTPTPRFFRCTSRPGWEPRVRTPGSRCRSSTTSSGSWTPRPFRRSCSVATRRGTRTTRTRRGVRPLTCRPFAGSSSGEPCCSAPDGDVAAAVDIAAELVHGVAS